MLPRLAIAHYDGNLIVILLSHHLMPCMVTDHVVAKVPESGFHLEPGFQYRNSITFLRNK